jgi:hypothetical protein
MTNRRAALGAPSHSSPLAAAGAKVSINSSAHRAAAKPLFDPIIRAPDLALANPIGSRHDGNMV